MRNAHYFIIQVPILSTLWKIKSPFFPHKIEENSRFLFCFIAFFPSNSLIFLSDLCTVVTKSLKNKWAQKVSKRKDFVLRISCIVYRIRLVYQTMLLPFYLQNLSICWWLCNQLKLHFYEEIHVCNCILRFFISLFIFCFIRYILVQLER